MNSKLLLKITYFLLIGLFIPIYAGNYYVSNSSTSTDWSSANNLNTPCDVTTAFKNAVAGDTVFFRGGTYTVPKRTTGNAYSGYYNFSNAGTADAPIVFMAYPGETPLFDGTVDESEEVEIRYYVTIMSANKSYVVLDGFSFQGNGGTTMPRVAGVGGDNGYTGPRPKGSVIKNCIFNGGGNATTFTSNVEAIFLENVSNFTVSNCKIYSYLQTNNNHNTSGIKTYHCDSLTVQNCEIYNCVIGIYYKSDTDNSNIRYNYLHDNNQAIFVAPETQRMLTDSLSIYHNLIINNPAGGIGWSGPGADPLTHGNDFEIYNNTFYNNGNRPCQMGYTTSGHGLGFFNNILVCMGTYSLVTSDGDEVTRNYLKAADHNQWGATFKTIRIGDNKRNINYQSLAAWQSSGQLENPIDVGCGDNNNPGCGDLSSDPKFVNASGTMSEVADFALQENSPCKGAGRDGVDMGADVSKVGITDGYVTSVTKENENEYKADKFSLSQNYPNPFNPSTTIKFRTPLNSPLYQRGETGGLVTLKIFDLLGREVATLVNEHKPAGNYTVEWNGTNSAGQSVGSGVYLYQLKTSSGFMETKKMLLIK